MNPTFFKLRLIWNYMIIVIDFILLSWVVAQKILLRYSDSLEVRSGTLIQLLLSFPSTILSKNSFSRKYLLLGNLNLPLISSWGNHEHIWIWATFTKTFVLILKLPLISNTTHHHNTYGVFSQKTWFLLFSFVVHYFWIC